MKISSLVIIVLIATAVFLGISVANHQARSTQPQDPQSLDVVNADNLIPRINDFRALNSLHPLTVDKALQAQAMNLSEAAARGDTADFYSSSSDPINAIVIKDDTLSGNYYSAVTLVSSFRVNPKARAFLLRRGTRIGVWATYIIRKEGAAPVPYVAIIIE